jgi:cell division protein ZipA
MGPFRWLLLLTGLVVIGLIFAYGRGLLPNRKTFRKITRFRRAPESAEPTVQLSEQREEPEEPAKRKAPPIASDSKVVTVRIMPPAGTQFPAEELVLALRNVGLRHGEFGIFHRMAETEGDSGDEEELIRYSVASLVEPGSFDLSNLRNSEYRGISIFMLLPAPEDGVKMFDEMLETAREIARQVDGRLLDEQGGAMSVQRERYMREEVIEFLRQHLRSDVQQIFSADG